MLDDIVQFLRGLLENWMWLFGGVVMMSIDFYERIKKGETKFKFVRWIAVGCVFIACFLTWRDEHKKASVQPAMVLQGASIVQPRNRPGERSLSITISETAGIPVVIKRVSIIYADLDLSAPPAIALERSPSGEFSFYRPVELRFPLPADDKPTPKLIFVSAEYRKASLESGDYIEKSWFMRWDDTMSNGTGDATPIDNGDVSRCLAYIDAHSVRLR